jgi:hypothetical protein
VHLTQHKQRKCDLRLSFNKRQTYDLPQIRDI